MAMTPDELSSMLFYGDNLPVLRSVMDIIFGVDPFRSTIVWKRVSAHNDARQFGNVCDHILFYSGSPIRADQIRRPPPRLGLPFIPARKAGNLPLPA